MNNTIRGIENIVAKEWGEYSVKEYRPIPFLVWNDRLRPEDRKIRSVGWSGGLAGGRLLEERQKRNGTRQRFPCLVWAGFGIRRNKMKDFFDPNGKMMELLWKPIHIMFLNLLWVLFSLPVVTIGASTTALYSVLIKMRNGKEGKLLRDFLDAFRNNFRQATIIWMIVAFAAVVFTTDIVYFANMGGLTGTIFAMVFLGLDVVLLYMSLYVFPMQAVFDNPIATTLKSALFLSSRHLGWTAVLLALAILTAIAVILYWPLTGWFIFGLAAFIDAWIFDRIFRRYYPEEERIQP